VREVGFDGGGAQEQLRGDCWRRHARGDEPEDLALARDQDGAVAVDLPRMDLGEDARLQRRVQAFSPRATAAIAPRSASLDQ
jgi:hypothetical protein